MLWLNHHPIAVKTFPNGELHMGEKSISKARLLEHNLISFKYENNGDLLKLLFLKKHLDFLGLPHTSLFIHYMPYSRMDRSENLSVFTLKYVADFINEMDFHKVTIVEPHSDVTTALVNRSRPWMVNEYLIEEVMEKVGFDEKTDYLFFPDAGAQKRYEKRFKDYNSLVGYKSRDFETGRITDFKLVGEKPDHPFKAIIIDDLTSYGGTFLLSGEHLREAGASEVHLLVAHAEEAVFEGKIFKTDIIDSVFATDSIISSELHWDKSQYKDRLHIFNLEKLYNGEDFHE